MPSYKLGYLQDDSVSRAKQGLPPQGLASLCYIYAKPDKLEQNPYFNNVMFPLRGLYVDYGIPSIPDDCPCLVNLRSP